MKPLVSNTLWALVEPLLPPHPPRRFRYPGRYPLSHRCILSGILFVLKTGIGWDDLPAELGWGCGRTCRQHLRAWAKAGVWDRLHLVLLKKLDDAGRIDWERAAVDSGSVPAPGGGADTGPNPTDRRKLGTKHHVLVDGTGLPLSGTVTQANRNDVTQLKPLLRKLRRFRGRGGRWRHYPLRVYGDRAYDSEPLRQWCRERWIEPHLPKKQTPLEAGLGRIRYVVERTISWLHRFRRLGRRLDRFPSLHAAFLTLAFCLIAFRMLC